MSAVIKADTYAQIYYDDGIQYAFWRVGAYLMFSGPNPPEGFARQSVYRVNQVAGIHVRRLLIPAWADARKADTGHG
jgi:hypothetical protein